MTDRPWDTQEVRKRMLAKICAAFAIKPDQLATLTDLMKRCGVVIAGSFVVEAILDVNWESSDVDVWMPSTKQSDVDDVVIWFMTHGYNGLRCDNVIVPDYTRLHAYVNEIMFLNSTCAQRTIHSYLNNRRPDFTQLIPIRKKVQILTAKRGKTVTDVVRSFDMNAVQFYFDGEAIHQVNPAAYTSLIHPGKISRVALKEQSLLEWPRTFVRLAKYAKRGITISEEGEAEIESAMNKNFARYEQKDKNDISAVLSEQLTRHVLRIIKGDQFRPLRLTLLNAITSDLPLTLRQYSPPRHLSWKPRKDELTLLLQILGAKPPVPLSQLKSVKVTSYPTTYYDFLMLSDMPIVEDDSAIYIGFAEQYVKMSLDQVEISVLDKDGTRSMFQCVGLKQFPPKEGQVRYVRISHAHMNVIVSLKNLLRIIQRDPLHPYWYLVPTRRTFSHTVSKQALGLVGVPSHLGANHCQAGTDMLVYKLRPVRLKNPSSSDSSGASPTV